MDKTQIAFENFLKAQIKYMEESKWYEGEKRHSDPGQDYLIDFVKNNSQKFRSAWDASKCKECKFSWKCGNLLLGECSEFSSL